MPADIDWGQVIFLALVVIVGFVRWVGNLIEQQKEAKARAQLSPEELAMREAAWRKQVGMDEANRQPNPPSPSPTPPDPFRELKDLFEQLREPTPAPAPKPPPLRRPPPSAPRTTAPRPYVQAPPPPPIRPVGVTKQVFVPTPTRAFPTSSSVQRTFTEAAKAGSQRPTSAKLTNLRRELATPKALRQAILIREVLGPPKALRTD